MCVVCSCNAKAGHSNWNWQDWLMVLFPFPELALTWALSLGWVGRLWCCLTSGTGKQVSFQQAERIFSTWNYSTFFQASRVWAEKTSNWQRLVLTQINCQQQCLSLCCGTYLEPLYYCQVELIDHQTASRLFVATMNTYLCPTALLEATPFWNSIWTEIWCPQLSSLRFKQLNWGNATLLNTDTVFKGLVAG